MAPSLAVGWLPLRRMNPESSEHIVVLTSSYPIEVGEAAGHFVEAEARALAQRGHRVTVLVPNRTVRSERRENLESGGRVDVRTVSGGTLFGSPGALPKLRQAPWKLAWLLPSTWQVGRWLGRNESEIDRVIAHWLLPGALPWALFLPNDLPLEVVAHGSDVRLLLAAPAWVRRVFLRRLLAKNTRLRFVSEALRDSLASASLPADLRAFVSHAEVHPAELVLQDVPSKTEARSRLEISSTDRWAVVVGRIFDKKRVDVALRALELVPDLHIAVIGDGPLFQALRRAHPEVQFVGQKSRAKALEWISAADLLVSASLEEGCPTVVREARLLDTPVVCRPVGDLSHWAQTDSELHLVK